jgi:hypothetical protein
VLVSALLADAIECLFVWRLNLCILAGELPGRFVTKYAAARFHAGADLFAFLIGDRLVAHPAGLPCDMNVGDSGGVTEGRLHDAHSTQSLPDTRRLILIR